jgi:hypothetical protein
LQSPDLVDDLNNRRQVGKLEQEDSLGTESRARNRSIR